MRLLAFLALVLVATPALAATCPYEQAVFVSTAAPKGQRFELQRRSQPDSLVTEDWVFTLRQGKVKLSMITLPQTCGNGRAGCSIQSPEADTALRTFAYGPDFTAPPTDANTPPAAILIPDFDQLLEMLEPGRYHLSPVHYFTAARVFPQLQDQTVWRYDHCAPKEQP